MLQTVDKSFGRLADYASWYAPTICVTVRSSKAAFVFRRDLRDLKRGLPAREKLEFLKHQRTVYA